MLRTTLALGLFFFSSAHARADGSRSHAQADGSSSHARAGSASRRVARGAQSPAPAAAAGCWQLRFSIGPLVLNGRVQMDFHPPGTWSGAFTGPMGRTRPLTSVRVDGNHIAFSFEGPHGTTTFEGTWTPQIMQGQAHGPRGQAAWSAQRCPP